MLGFENNNDYYKQNYGIEMLSLEDEEKLPYKIRRTIDNKIDIVDTCDWIIIFAEQTRERARRIPMLDDEVHSAMVDKYRKLVVDAYEAMKRATFYNGNESLD